jgi:uncharacterized hydrophobic protein (TIGR00271 family)
MVVGPEFGPLAALCVALVQRRAAMAARSAAALAVGFPLGIAVAFILVLILRAAGPAPDVLTAQGQAATFFISHPDVYSVLVALLAGVAGLLSLTTAKSGALLGVLISVTTIPAAANVGVAAAYADWQQARGALAQLALNVACIVIAGAMTLAAQRLGFRRRLRRARGNTDTGLLSDLSACWPPTLAVGHEPYWLVRAGEDGEPGANGALVARGGLHRGPVLIAGVADIDDVLRLVASSGGKVAPGQAAGSRRGLVREHPRPGRQHDRAVPAGQQRNLRPGITQAASPHSTSNLRGAAGRVGQPLAAPGIDHDV